MQTILNILSERGVEYSQIQSLERLFLIILLIPVVATIIGIARYIVGLRTINFYTPLFATFIFFDISNIDESTNFLTGLKYGLLFFVCIFVITSLFYRILKSLRMHYIPKLSLIITAGSISIAILIATLLYFERSLPLSISPFLFIALIASAESFMGVYAKKNFKYTLSLAIESLIISVISFAIISLEVTQNFILNNLWILLILIIINLLVGRFLGLRISEYWRFRKLLIKSDSTDEPDQKNLKK